MNKHVVNKRRGVIFSAVIVAVVAALFLVDSIAAANAERNLARHLREAENLPAEPYVSLGGFAYLSSLISGQWSSITVRSRDMEIEEFGLVTVNADAINVQVPASSVWSGEFSDSLSELFYSRLQFDGVALGAQLGISDLLIENYKDISPAGNWEAEAIFEGTPPGADDTVSVLVELRIHQGNVELSPVEVLSNPPEVPEQEALDAFKITFPSGTLPLPHNPTRIFVEGGSINIESEQMNVRVSPEDFLPRAGDEVDFK